MRCFVALRPDAAVDDDVDALLARVAAPGLSHHLGPWWTPREVLVVASGTPYRVLHRVGVGDAE